MTSFEWTRFRAGILAFAVALSGCDDGEEELDAGPDAGRMTDGGPDAGGGEMDAGMDSGGGDVDAGMDAGPDMDAGPSGNDGGGVGGGPATTAQIAAVLAAAAGPTDLPIDDAVVTYLKPLIGTEPAGFFLQAETFGPAVFVAVDPAGLTPPAEVGQVVDLRATDLSDIATNDGRREIVAISGWNVDSSGNDVSFLIQDVSSINLVTELDDYTAELITTTFEIRGTYRFAGAGYQQISIDTPGLINSDDISLRMPDALVSTLGLEPNCQYRVTGTPLWRLGPAPQVSTFDASEVTLVSCDPPLPTHADALNERTIVVRFSRPLLATSVAAGGGQFTVTITGNPDIPVTAAVAGDDYVVLTTGADLVGGMFYVVHVDSTVLDTRSVGVPAATSTAIFEGYTPHLVINEVDYDQMSTDTAEFVEIHNPSLSTAIPLAGLTLYTIDISAGTGSVNAMIDLVPNSTSATELAPGGYLLVLTPSSSGVTVPGGVPTVTLGSNLQNSEEGVLLASSTTCHDAVFYEGIPTSPATLQGCGYESVAGTDTGFGAFSLQRIPNGSDFDESPLDFEAVAPTSGGANAP